MHDWPQAVLAIALVVQSIALLVTVILNINRRAEISSRLSSMERRVFELEENHGRGGTEQKNAISE